MFVLICIFSSDLFPFYVFVCILNTDTSFVLIQYYSGIAICRFIFTVRCSCFRNSLVHSFPFYSFYCYLVFFYSSHHVILILITFFYLFILVCVYVFFSLLFSKATNKKKHNTEKYQNRPTNSFFYFSLLYLFAEALDLLHSVTHLV